jgi:hypothetical protein
MFTEYGGDNPKPTKFDNIKRLWIDFWFVRKYDSGISYGSSPRHWLLFKTQKLINIILFIMIMVGFYLFYIKNY